MKQLGINEIREEFLRFFETKGHLRVKSFPLVPQNDQSLLLINSGMAPMKKWFLGQDTPPAVRVTTCQKCIRTPDIERVGKTARHGTFFEMLGNFSFGDYFKDEATAWAWEFLTQVLEISADRLWVSIYLDDDEAFDIWTKQRGVAPDRIVRLGKEDNFWEIGSGPCGPCSEIYYDRGPEKGCDKPGCGVGCDCDRYVEIWNLVFSQFNADAEGHYHPMEHPNIDTGMGLERLACILQGVDNLFEVDTVRKIIGRIGRIAKSVYGKDAQKDVCMRVIADHLRGSVFLISDGVLPSNEGRGYVLRRLLRRAERNGRQLGINKPFLHVIADTVIEENAKAYPELFQNADYIKKIILAEEENFGKILERGMNMMNDMIDRIDSGMATNPVISGEQVFLLCDTYGFPYDLIQEMVAERDMTIDEEAYYKLLDEQRQRARAAGVKGSGVAWKEQTIETNVPKTKFVGYECYSCEAKLWDLFVDGKKVKEAHENDRVELIFDRTPFYAQSGGQVSDHGVFAVGEAVVNIRDCQKTADGHFVHEGILLSGSLTQGQNGNLQIDGLRRNSIMRNHTAAHLLQQALRDVLGDHVHQAGQLVNDKRVRFDFNHFEAMTREELVQVEAKVNEKILEALSVTVTEMDIETARKRGAMALFGEKYGEIVRVVDAGGYAVELCGGCHVDNTARIALFKITGESSAAAGVRRIEAVTGTGVLALIRDMTRVITTASKNLKLSNLAELPNKCQSMAEEIKEKDRKIEKLNQHLATTRLETLVDQSSEAIGGVKTISASFNGIEIPALRQMGDRIKQKNDEPIVAVFAAINDGKGTLLAVANALAMDKGIHAGQLVKQIAMLTGGKGGGRPESAMAGVNEIFKIDEALAQLPAMVQQMLG